MNKRDDKAPKAIIASFTNDEGKVIGSIPVMPKNFSTGSVGFYGSGKLLNPNNPTANYQISVTMTLIGSKPE